MDKIQLLQERKKLIETAGKNIREQINSLIDAESFVELSTFSFSKNEFYDESVTGEGVVTGFATLDGYPYYIIAQNYEVMNGGVSKANCDKIAKCLDVDLCGFVAFLRSLNEGTHDFPYNGQSPCARKINDSFYIIAVKDHLTALIVAVACGISYAVKVFFAIG